MMISLGWIKNSRKQLRESGFEITFNLKWRNLLDI